MPDFLKRNKYQIFAAIVILLMAFGIRFSFPNANEYYYGADEGHYLAFANAIKDKGFFEGMYASATSYATTPNSFIWPNPLRIFYIFLGSLFIRFTDGMTGLSYLSLFSYVLMLLLSFRFIRKHFTAQTALLFIILLAVSPLSLGMSCRALLDSTSYLMLIASIISFINYLVSPNRLRLIVFILVYILCILTKELNVILFPFFITIYLYRYTRKDSILRLSGLAFIVVVIPLATFLVYISILGTGNFFAIIKTLSNITKITEVHKYYAIFNRGPWYKYIIDFTILSPTVLLLAFLLTGYYFNALSTNRTWVAVCGFILVGYVVIVCTISKNVRYIMPIDWLLRLMIALGLPIVLEKYKLLARIRKVALVLVVFILVLLDLSTFYNFFLIKKIYDPVNYQLLDAGGVLPSWNYSSEIKDNSAPPVNIAVPDIHSANKKEAAAAYINQSLAYYRDGKYELCIQSCKQSIALDSTSATAWNNMCAAFNMLQQWDSAIMSANKALQIQPDFTLARNNLNYAVSQKKK
jgi:hypothetical protein